MSILGPMLFYIFINGLDDGIKCAMMVSDDNNISGEVGTFEERTTLQGRPV